jgi:hypothetical protein
VLLRIFPVAPVAMHAARLTFVLGALASGCAVPLAGSSSRERADRPEERAAVEPTDSSKCIETDQRPSEADHERWKEGRKFSTADYPLWILRHCEPFQRERVAYDAHCQSTSPTPVDLVALTEQCLEVRRVRASRDSLQHLRDIAKETTLLLEERVRLNELELVEEQKDQALAASLRDPMVSRLGHSARICQFQQVRAEDASEIQTELKYARQGGGVVDAGKLHELQEHQRNADAEIATSMAQLKSTGARPLKCSDPRVYAVLYCATLESIELHDGWYGITGRQAPPKPSIPVNCASSDLKAEMEIVTTEPEPSSWESSN